MTVDPPLLAIDGGEPVRRDVLPYARQWLDERDEQAVLEVLRSDWLTTGPSVTRFEDAVRERTGAAGAVAVSSGTAALHAVMHAAGVGAGDEVIVPAMTFAATANAAVFQGATPVFADVLPGTLLVDPERVATLVGPRTRAIVGVDYGGQPCDYEALGQVAERQGLALIADAAHSLGASLRGRPVGTLADLTTLSFHPVKHITTGEGGMVLSAKADRLATLRRFRNHGFDRDHLQRAAEDSWRYDMIDLGFNYRLTDIQSALGMSQLARLDEWIARRRDIASRYTAFLRRGVLPARPLDLAPGVEHAYHLYVVSLDQERLSVGRDRVFAALRAEGIGVNVHYTPVHLHRFYRERFGTGPGGCPVAEAAFDRILSLPMFPAMTDGDVEDVARGLTKVLTAYAVP